MDLCHALDSVGAGGSFEFGRDRTQSAGRRDQGNCAATVGGSPFYDKAA